MAALVVGALAQLGDKTAWLSAILADRWKRPGAVLVAAMFALVVAYTLASAAGRLVAPTLTPNAKQLLLGLSLAIASTSMPFAPKEPDRLSGWRLGAFPTAFLGLLIMALGDTATFAVAALAARSALPWLAGVGATLGALAVVAPAAVLGERAYTALPLRPVRWAAGAVLLVAGLVLALSGLRLV